MKAALLTALAYRPDLVVLDEPFTGLDPVVRDELIRALLEMPGDRPFTVLVSSHDIDEVERLADSRGLHARTAGWPCRSRSRRCSSASAASRSSCRKVGWRFRRRGPSGSCRACRAGPLRFIDTDHRGVDAETRIRSAFAGAEVRATPMTLREIFVTLARPGAREVAS